MVLLFLSLAMVDAQDQRLTLLSDSLAAVRSHPEQHEATRGATIQFDQIKHQLRDWIEARLVAVPKDTDEKALTLQVNDDLRRAGLFQLSTSNPQAYDFSLLGSIKEVELRFESDNDFLIIITGIGIQCGYDESAYVYRWNGSHWQRVLQSEQNSYTEQGYQPQTIDAVLISRGVYGDGGRMSDNRLLLTLGSNSWCTSNWGIVYYRLWRTDSSSSKLVFDKMGSMWGLDEEQGTVGPDDALIEFWTGSLDGDLLTRTVVHHYKVTNDGRIERTDPIALRPPDFVEEWLREPWSQARLWSESANRGRLYEWHNKYGVDEVRGHFHPTSHCVRVPDVWQVAIQFEKPVRQTLYFLVRWRPPYRFTLAAISTESATDCREPDPVADENRTLFGGRR